MVPDINSVAERYTQVSDGLGEVSGHGRTYREVRFPDWPPAIHFEFIPRSSRYQIEFHWQVPDFEGVSATFDKLAADSHGVFPACAIRRSRRAVQRHMVSIRLKEDQTAEAVAQDMHRFVLFAKPVVEKLALSARRRALQF